MVLVEVTVKHIVAFSGELCMCSYVRGMEYTRLVR